MKKHLGFIIFLVAIIFIFLGKLIFMKASFLNGDYLQQFYPWSKIYSEAIKNFSFPFWIRYVNSGFPLMAEGQIGGFYPLNIILFFLLPFNIAYNYSIVIHFILGGIFTYIYSRKLQADQWGAALSALVFCFGSTYAGCFYNMITLRVLLWVPLGFFIIEKYFENKKISFNFYLGIILGIQLLAGFAQMAIYSALFYMIYFIYGLKIRQSLKINDIIKIGISFFVAFILFLPQFILSLKMAGLSTRGNTSLGFALWGSFNPINLIGLCFPKIIFYGSQFYIGVFTLIFFIFAMCASKREVKIKPIFIILLVSFFFSLGTYNPLFILFLKITQFYSFRNPSKFIFFSCFAAAILSGWGFTHFFKTKDIKERKQALAVTALFIGISAFMFILSGIIIRLFKERIINIGEWYATHYIFGQSHHRLSLDMYLWKVKTIYIQLFEVTSLSNIFILISFVLCITAIFMFMYLFKTRKTHSITRIFFIIVIFIDLFNVSFYGIGFGGNEKSFNELEPTHKKILEILKHDKSLFRIMPLWFYNGNMPWWSRPSANAIVGLDSIASYSPLVQKSYKDAVSSLEIVDDSLGIGYASHESIKDNYNLLRLLNVKYIISAHKINFDFLEEIMEEDTIYLYKLKGFLPRVFFASSLENQPNIIQDVLINIIKYSDGYIEIEAVCTIDGFVVFSENYYPGWDVYVDGLKKENIRFENLIQAVAVDRGKHKIIFKYRPY